jgi:hypothetical protein
MAAALDKTPIVVQSQTQSVDLESLPVTVNLQSAGQALQRH